MSDLEPTDKLARHGFRNLKAVHFNLSAPALYEEAVRRGEGHVAVNGPLVVRTGIHTGRSAGDKFVVRDASTESTVWWDANKAKLENKDSKTGPGPSGRGMKLADASYIRSAL